MGLELTVRNKFDGNNVPAFHVIDGVNVNLVGNMAQVSGRVFISQAAFQAGLAPIDNFSYNFPDFKNLLKTLPSSIEADAYGWLKSLPQFTGAIEKDATAAVAAAAAADVAPIKQ